MDCIEEKSHLRRIMNIENERKFLVDYISLMSEPLWVNNCSIDRVNIFQGYFTKDGPSVRVSITSKPSYSLVIKSPYAQVRKEFIISLSEFDAQCLMDVAPTEISKIRYWIGNWEIDQIITTPNEVDAYKHLWLAEWEDREGYEFPDSLPTWIEKEVTGDHQYSMQSLAWKYGRK